jgi:hypothetical protein
MFLFTSFLGCADGFAGFCPLSQCKRSHDHLKLGDSKEFVAEVSV